MEDQNKSDEGPGLQIKQVSAASDGIVLENVEKRTQTGSDTGEFVSAHFEYEMAYSGPIPHPNMIAAYGKVDKTFPALILDQWCKENDHSRAVDLEKIEIIRTGQNANIALKDKAHGRCFIICIIILSFGALLILSDKVLAGSIFSGIGVLGPLVGFLTLKENAEDQSTNQQEAQTATKTPSKQRRRRRRKK